MFEYNKSRVACSNGAITSLVRASSKVVFKVKIKLKTKLNIGKHYTQQSNSVNTIAISCLETGSTVFMKCFMFTVLESFRLIGGTGDKMNNFFWQRVSLRWFAAPLLHVLWKGATFDYYPPTSITRQYLSLILFSVGWITRIQTFLCCVLYCAIYYSMS